MTTTIMTVAAIIVLAVLVGLPFAQAVLANGAHKGIHYVDSESYEREMAPKTILTDGTASEFLMNYLTWEEEREEEQAELRVLAKGLVYEAGLESPLSAPQIVPVAPLFAPLPANGNNGLFAANG